ncbi:MAG: hypothetical protein NC120_11980 [Ruminococcus sp.]|nr:hypothetical protein [Ruminococcus sp.]
MKYDSSMKRYDPDIRRNLYAMCGEDESAARLAKESSPALLREYLKKAYGHSGRAGGGIRYNCSTSKGVNIILDGAVNNDGDKTLTLSWSQTAVFIRKRIEEGTWDEPVENQTSHSAEGSAEADKPKPTYFDILLEHYPDFDEDRFDEFVNSVCVAVFFDDGGKSGHINPSGICEECWKSKCKYPWRHNSTEAETDIKNYLKDTQPSVLEEKNDAETADLPNPSVSSNNEKAPDLFDYSALDTETAQELRNCETVIRQKTAGYFTLLGGKFKEAQTLLSNHANGTFEKWYTALGFKRQTVYNLIERYDFLSSPALAGREDDFEALPITLSYDVSREDAPEELTEKVLSGDITTHAEYIKLKKELEEANRRSESEKKARESISQNFDGLHEGYKKYKDKYVNEYYKNADLEKRIKELENCPVEVAVQQDESILEEPEQLREENARLKDKDIKNMLIRITLKDYEQLLDLVKDTPLYAALSRAEFIKL